MVNLDIIKISSKGQVVIPANMRDNFREGDELLIIKDDDRIILRKVEHLTEKMKEDLEFAKRTEEAYKRIEKGEGISMNFDEFIKEMEEW